MFQSRKCKTLVKPLENPCSPKTNFYLFLQICTSDLLHESRGLEKEVVERRSRESRCIFKSTVCQFLWKFLAFEKNRGGTRIGQKMVLFFFPSKRDNSKGLNIVIIWKFQFVQNKANCFSNILHKSRESWILFSTKYLIMLEIISCSILGQNRQK